MRNMPSEEVSTCSLVYGGDDYTVNTAIFPGDSLDDVKQKRKEDKRRSFDTLPLLFRIPPIYVRNAGSEKDWERGDYLRVRDAIRRPPTPLSS